MKILAVDDDPIILEVLSVVLRDAGHEVVTAGDGRAALDLLRRDGLRLVISDWNMEGMDGLDLCRRVRAEALNGYIYVILLTSRHETADIVAGLSAGADDFISKPFEPAELRVRIATAERIISLETRHVAIFALAKLAESRDPETGYHLERIRTYSRLLADWVVSRAQSVPGEKAQYAQTIYLTSPLHDIGKVGIPDYVLLKPGRLTDSEFEVMKHHTTIGATTLSAAVKEYPGVEYLRMARDIALTHHERFNGCGYPAGLRGEDIPLCGRIVALADVYDALTSKRVYKDAMSHDIARSIILKERGEQFDPLVADAFLANEERFIATARRFGEEAALAAE